MAAPVHGALSARSPADRAQLVSLARRAAELLAEHPDHLEGI
jgi:hypothetical protein